MKIVQKATMSPAERRGLDNAVAAGSDLRSDLDFLALIEGIDLYPDEQQNEEEAENE